MPEETKDAQPTNENEIQKAQQTEAEATEQDTEAEDDLPAFDFVAEDIADLRKKVIITVPRERIDTKLDEMYGELRGSAQVPGFRIGHAPRRLIEKRFGKDVSQDVRNAMVGEALGDVLDKAEFKTLGEPDLELDDIEIPDSGPMIFSFEVEVAPEFNLPNLEGIPVEKQAFKVTDERIGEYLDQLRQSRATFEATEDPAAEGDVMEADTKVTVEGEEPVEAKDQPLRVAAGQIEGLPLVDLGEALTGKTGGETAAMNVEVPMAHPNEAWQGKQAAVEVTVKSISRRILPELDESFAEAMGFDSLDELREYVGERMIQRVEADTQQAMRDQVSKYLLDNTEFDLPSEMAARHAARTLQRHYVDLLQRGVSREQIEENLTEIKAAANERSANDLKLEFVLAKIAENENLESDEGEVNSQIAQMAAMQNRRPERLRQELDRDGNLGLVESQIIEGKVIAKLLESAKITEIEPPAEVKEEKPKKSKAKKSAKKAEKKADEKKTNEKKVAKKSAKKAAKKTSKKKDE